MTTTGVSDLLDEAIPRLSSEMIKDLVVKHWGLSVAVVRPLDGESVLNVAIDDDHVLKIGNPAEDRAAIEMEIAAMRHVAEVDPTLPIPRVVSTRTGGDVVVIPDETGRPCPTRLITVVPGTRLEGRPITTDLAEQIGAYAARTSLALAGFFHPAAGRRLDWDVRRAGEVVRSSGTDPELLRLVERVEPTLRTMTGFAGGIQHADVTLTNVLATDDRLTGLIDFGDLHHTADVCDLAVTITSVVRNTASEQPAGLWELVNATITGYQRHRRLGPADVGVLGELIIARLLITAAISQRRADVHVDNRAYITQYDRANRRVLDQLAALAPADLAARLHTIAGTRISPPGDLGSRRAAAMGGPLAPLFYRQPLDIVRGAGAYLFDRDGRRYLDAYNNVAVVGHAHPTVTNAVGRQLAELNTHSRYLHPAIVELSERLIATMPDGLDTVLFTTSGTEANELAWRLATAWTAGEGALIAEHAYHGATRWMADLSSNEWPPGHRPTAVGTFRAPIDPVEQLGAAEAGHRIESAADQLGVIAPALVLADCQFTSEGIHNAPPEYFLGLVEGAHRVGALFLADEVQSGFGRSGPQLWRFALAGITPDLVSLGKPMGAGYPIGAVITRREIADRLAGAYEYFSTFAATPAAAAAGLAVLDVLSTERLPESAVSVGEQLRTALVDLAKRHDALGAVRGYGLLAGVDVRPGRAYAQDLLNRLVEHGVLAGLTGPRGDVLKIRPPLVWGPTQVDQLLAALELALTASPRG